jgi:hypothetical protein
MSGFRVLSSKWKAAHLGNCVVSADQLPFFVFRLQFCGGPYIPINAHVLADRGSVSSIMSTHLGVPPHAAMELD